MFRMIPLSLLIVALSIGFIHGLQKKNFEKKTTRSEFGKRLDGHVFMTAGGLDPQHCLADCWQVNDRCESFNILVEEKVCELNNRSKENAPNNFTDRVGSVYCTNPAFGRGAKLELPRHDLQYPQQSQGYCASDPCTNNGKCVLNDKTGFRCVGCNSGYYGLRCEQRHDPCLASPCQNGGTCRSSAQTGFICECPFPYINSICSLVRRDYQFNFDGVSAFAKSSPPSHEYSRFVVWFWFKTEQVLAYFCSFVPAEPTSEVRLTVWKNGTTIYVELKKDYVMNFSFPYSHPLDNNGWHVVSVVFTNGFVEVYLDGGVRETKKQFPHSQYHLPDGHIYLGVHKINSITSANFFSGSINAFDFLSDLSGYSDKYIDFYFLKCIPLRSSFGASTWHGFRYAVLQDSCGTKYPINRIISKTLLNHTASRSLKLGLPSPRNLSSLTLSFWLGAKMPTTDGQLVYYGDNENCAFSVVIEKDLKLAIKVLNVNVKVDLVPIFDDEPHHVAITWTSEGGVVEVIIDAILQSRFVDVATNDIIPPQSQFAVGGSLPENKNFVGSLKELNMWYEVLPLEMLYSIAASGGNDVGNFAAWKDVLPHSYTAMRSGGLELLKQRAEPSADYLHFPSSSAGNYSLYIASFDEHVHEMTFSSWVKIDAFPAVLTTVATSRSSEEFMLSIDSELNVQLKMFDENITLEHDVALLARDHWHFIAVSWSAISGSLAFQSNAIHTPVDSSFKSGHSIPHNPAHYYIGSVNQSFKGYIRETNYWNRALPESVLKVMSRGCQGLIGDRVLANFPAFLIGEKGNVKHYVLRERIILPAYLVQKKRDQFCNDEMHSHACLYYARLGYDGSGKKPKLGCFCESSLTNDGNYHSNSLGDYTLDGNLAKIVDY